MTTIMTAVPITDYAIIVDPKDSVAVVKKETFAGLELAVPPGREMRVNAVVSPGHRFATREIPAGEYVLQYGQPVPSA